MDRLNERLGVARQALATLAEVARLAQPTAIERDAAIQRFEYTFEATWKSLQQYLRDVEKLQAGSPRAVIRGARRAGLVDDAQARLALAMCDDRNLTVHTYNEALARAIYGRLGAYVDVLGAVLDAMGQGADAR